MSFFIEVGSCDFDTCERLIKNCHDVYGIDNMNNYYDVKKKII